MAVVVVVMVAVVAVDVAEVEAVSADVMTIAAYLRVVVMTMVDPIIADVDILAVEKKEREPER